MRIISVGVDRLCGSFQLVWIVVRIVSVSLDRRCGSNEPVGIVSVDHFFECGSEAWIVIRYKLAVWLRPGKDPASTLH